jgi:ribosomal protein S18 acetylase RimI-like enzyme
VIHTIRPRTAEDLPDCVTLLAEVHHRDGYPTHWPDDPTRWLTSSRLLGAWVAEGADGIVGHIGLSSGGGDVATLWSLRTGRPAEQAAEITRLCVSGGARGHRLGDRLMARACAEAANHGLHPVLGVLDHNRAAIALYERSGWYLLSFTELTLPDGRVFPMRCYAAPEAC